MAHRTAAMIVLAAVLAAPTTAWALPEIAAGFSLEVGCQTCHDNDWGGRGCSSPPCLNPFGDAYRALLVTGADPVWGPALGNVDHDGDGYTSAEELGDFDFDGVRDFDDWPMRSPGLADGADGADMNECDFPATECPPLERCRNLRLGSRPTYECVCGPETEGRRDASGTCVRACDEGFERFDGECVPACEAGFERRDGICLRRFYPPRPVELPDGVWVDVVLDDAVGGVWETECAPDGRVGGYSVYFEYPNDCPEGEVWVESEVGAVLAVQGSRLGPERGCEDGSPVQLDPDLLLRAPLSAGRVRASCVARASSGSTRRVSEEGPTCSTALGVTDGMHTLDLAPTGVPTPFDDDVCFADLRSDVWLSYTATCDGRLTVDFAGPDWCREIHGQSIGIYPPSACPTRGPSYACEYWQNDRVDDFSPDCGGDDGAAASVSVRRGETMLIRLDGWQGAFRSVHDIAIACVEGGRCDPFFCAEAALCDDANLPVTCTCLPGWTGDGIPVERGGTGCTPPPPGPTACEEAGFTCDDDGACVVRWETAEEYLARLAMDPMSEPVPMRIPFCRCNPGYAGSGISCAPIDECAEGISGCPTNADCIDETPGHRCVCAAGFQDDPFTEELECVTVCGDGERAPGEECDDGNTADGDGCSTRCEVEPTFRCFDDLPPASWCESTCGDDLIDPDDDLCPAGGDSSCEPLSCAVGAEHRGGPFGAAGLALLAVAGLVVRRRRRGSRL